MIAIPSGTGGGDDGGSTSDDGMTWDAPTATDGFGSWEDDGGTSVPDDSDDDGADYDAGDTTGLTNDGTTVVDRNDPVDVEDDDEGYLPGTNITMEEWRDQSEDYPSQTQSDGTGGVPEDYDGTDSEYYDEAAGGDNGAGEGDAPGFTDQPVDENPDSPIGDNDIDGDGEAEHPLDFSEYDAPDVDLDVPDDLGVDVPWKLVGGAAVVLGLLALTPSASTVAGAGAAASGLGD